MYHYALMTPISQSKTFISLAISPLMCLAIPGKITAITGTKAIVDYGGVQREIDISLIDPKIGDYVIVHAGFAIQLLDKQDAEETIAIFKELLEHA